MKGRSLEEFEQHCRDRRNFKDELIHLKDKYRNDEDKLNQQLQQYKNAFVEKEKNATKMKATFERFTDLEEALRSNNERFETIDSTLRQKQQSKYSDNLWLFLMTVNDCAVVCHNFRVCCSCFISI